MFKYMCLPACPYFINGMKVVNGENASSIIDGTKEFSFILYYFAMHAQHTGLWVCTYHPSVMQKNNGFVLISRPTLQLVPTNNKPLTYTMCNFHGMSIADQNLYFFLYQTLLDV